MKSYSDIDLYPAAIIRRIFAFVIDSFMSFVPLLAVLLLLTANYRGYGYIAPAFHAFPLIGLITMVDVPENVHEAINTQENDIGGTYHDYDSSLGATFKRLVSVVAIVFYVFYGTFTTCIFEGKTFGKHLMKINTVAVDTEKPMKKLLFREIFGKVILNTIPIIPLISFFTIIFTPKHLSIHDMIFGTRVVELLENQ